MQARGVDSTIETGVRVGRTVTKRSVNNASRTRSAVAGHDSDGDERRAEQHIQHDGKECEERLASQAARQNNGEEGVDDSNSRHALDGFLPMRNGNIVLFLSG